MGHEKHTTPLPGISFILRVRDEETTLVRSLLSLRGITVPYTIHVVLHNCQDTSEKIARAHIDQLPIEIHNYNVEISRPGYETLITPKEHEHSLITYYNFCFGLATHSWSFKWDADFVMTPELQTFINDSPLFHEDYEYPTRLKLSACFDGIENAEYYLSNCLMGFTKQVFWEVPLFAQNSIALNCSQLRIEHLSALTDMKRYWRRPAWFANTPPLQQKYNRLVDIAGQEPVGCARASNPECDKVLAKISRLEDVLRRENILFYE